MSWRDHLPAVRGKLLFDEPLAPFTWFRVGGPADVLFLPEDESIANALRLFRKARRPMALVRNEEGKILGLVTLEDILEEIIGDIEDEHDRPTPKLKLVPRLKRVLPKTVPALPAPKPPAGKPAR